jgi:hypothetical protein
MILNSGHVIKHANGCTGSFLPIFATPGGCYGKQNRMQRVHLSNHHISTSTLLRFILISYDYFFYISFFCFSFSARSHPGSCNSVSAANVVLGRWYCSALPFRLPPPAALSAGQCSTTVQLLWSVAGQWWNRLVVVVCAINAHCFETAINNFYAVILVYNV